LLNDLVHFQLGLRDKDKGLSKPDSSCRFQRM
jgi:hypothetical protein